MKMGVHKEQAIPSNSINKRLGFPNGPKTLSRIYKYIYKLCICNFSQQLDEKNTKKRKS